LRHLPSLERQGLIRIARTEPSEKGGKDRKIYELTFRGLMKFLLKKFKDLKEDSRLFENVNVVAEKHPDLLPLLFGKWDLFKKHGFSNIIIKRLKQALSNPFLHDADLSNFNRNEINYYLTRKVFFGLPWDKYDKSLEELMKILHQDNDLKDFTDKYLQEREKELEIWMTNLRLWEQLWDNL